MIDALATIAAWSLVGGLALLVVEGPESEDGTPAPAQFETVFAQAMWLKTCFGADRCPHGCHAASGDRVDVEPALRHAAPGRSALIRAKSAAPNFSRYSSWDDTP